MINTKAVLTSSFHATKHNMQHCNPALGVIKLCNYSLDCWIYGLNDLNTDKTVVTRASVAKLLPPANSYYDLTLILFTNRMNWIVMSSQKPHNTRNMICDILNAEPRHVSRLRKSWYLVFLWFKCHQNPLSEGEMFDGCLMRAAQWRMGTDECREDHCVISHSCRQSQASGHTFPTFSRTFHKSIKPK